MHTISIEMKTKSSDKYIAQVSHNLRTKKAKSDVNREANFIIENGELIPLSIANQRDISNKQYYKDERSKIEKWEVEDQANFKNSDDVFYKNKDGENTTRKSWSDVKHLVSGEGVIWFGAGFELDASRLDDIEAFRNKRYSDAENEGVVYSSPDEETKMKIIQQAIDNTNNYLVENGGQEAYNFVLHSGEAGQSHLHFQYRNSSENGLSLNLHTNGNQGSQAQDMICENMSVFGLMRGIPKENKKSIATKKQAAAEWILTEDRKQEIMAMENPTPQFINKVIGDWANQKLGIISQMETQSEIRTQIIEENLRIAIALRTDIVDLNLDATKINALLEAIGREQQTNKQVIADRNMLDRINKMVAKQKKKKEAEKEAKRLKAELEERRKRLGIQGNTLDELDNRIDPRIMPNLKPR